MVHSILTVYILRRYVSNVADRANHGKDFALFLSFEFLRNHPQQYFACEVNDVDVDSVITKQDHKFKYHLRV